MESNPAASEIPSAFDNAAIGVVHTGLDGRFLRVNNKFCEMTGYGRAELLTKHFQDITHPDDVKDGIAALQRYGAGEVQDHAIEKRYICKDGRVLWVKVNVINVAGPSGRTEYFMSVVEDTTERKHAEELLRTSEANMAAAQRIARFGSWEVVFSLHEALSGNPLHWSDEVFRIFGYEPGAIEVSQENFFKAVHPEDRGPVLEAAEKAVASGERYSIDHRILLPNGETRHVHEEAQVFKDPGTGRPLKMVGTVHDITERTISTERIAEQAALLNQTRDAITMRDLNGTILFWNNGAERITGWTAAEAVGQKITELVFADIARYEEALKATLDKGEWFGEIQSRTKDNRQLILESRWSLLRGKDGQPKSVLAIHTDVTEKKRIESQFLRAQRMESIGTLAGGIAHDLNNVLAPILMSIEVLKDSVKPEDMPVLENIEGSARRGAEMVKQVLSFARGLDGQRIEVQPRYLIKEIERIIKDTFPRNITLDIVFPADSWMVLGDPTQLHQVIMNLCVNARDAMPGGGMLGIRVENVALDAGQCAELAGHVGNIKPGPHMLISVSDTGTGIAPGVLDKIFEPFFTTKETGRGTGLGLSTALTIVKSHEGAINVRSEQGRGTVFAVYLPAVTAFTQRREEPGLANLPRGNGELLFLVDDEAPIINITRRALESFGYRVIVAVDGCQAVEIYGSRWKEIALVLTDMMMPVMDGAEAIGEFRKINPGAKIIGMSGLQKSKVLPEKSGVKHFLMKPFTAGTLLNAVKDALDGE
jgi:PAS domain S-box-containing protein